MPVGAGTPRLQQASLRLWEAIEAARARRPRVKLFHSALKLGLADGGTYTLELTPMFIGGSEPPILTGPVGLRGADRFRLFRYQLRGLPVTSLPDEEWAVESPVRLSDECDVVDRMLELAPSVPRHIWGRRVPGTREMWTSDSVISWLLFRAGLDLSDVRVPDGGRAPGWNVGLQLAAVDHDERSSTRQRRSMPIDVMSQVTVRRPRPEVAAFLRDVSNDHRWIRALSSPAETLSMGDYGKGTRIRRVAKMAGRSIDYTTEVVEYVPDELTTMDTVSGPFPMRVTYALADSPDGTTVSVRNEGGKGLLFRIFGPVIGRMVRSRVDGDLGQLKRLLEMSDKPD